MQPIFIKDFLPSQLLNVCHSYCLIKYSNKKNFTLDSQTSSLVTEHGDYLMETIMDLSTPVVEQNVGKKLWPTYSFFRIYDKGSEDEEKDENSDYKYFDENRKLTRLKIDGKFPMKKNNALIFKGMDKLHWREICEHDNFITVFLHYVDQEGDYKEYKYDKRKMLGE